MCNSQLYKRWNEWQVFDWPTLLSDLFLLHDILSPLKDFDEEDIEALRSSGRWSGYHGAQVVDDVVHALLAEAQHIEEGHDITLALRQDLLQKGLLEEAPSQPGQRPVNDRLQTHTQRDDIAHTVVTWHSIWMNEPNNQFIIDLSVNTTNCFRVYCILAQWGVYVVSDG